MSSAVIAAGRTAAELQMVDACTVTRGSTEPVWNEGTNEYTIPAGATVYTGRCKVQTRDVIVTEVDAGEREVGVVRWEIHLPVNGSGDVRRGDVVTVTASQLDSSLVGRKFTVQGPHAGTAKTARRLPVEAAV